MTAQFMTEGGTQEAEFLRLSYLLMKQGKNLRDVYPARLTRILGGSGSRATVYYLGANSFSDPRVLVEKLKTMFGNGTDALLEGLIDRANEVLGGAQ